jgi:hypothetical protein
MLLAFGVTGGIIALLSISVFLLMAFRETVLAAAQDEYSVLFAALLALWAIHLQFSGNFGDGANIFLLAGFALGRIAASSNAPDMTPFFRGHIKLDLKQGAGQAGQAGQAG